MVIQRNKLMCQMHDMVDDIHDSDFVIRIIVTLADKKSSIRFLPRAHLQ